MNYWLVSDTHFNHTKLEEWGGRSGDWQKQLWAGFNVIPDGDTLIHLGDICIGNDEEVHQEIERYSKHNKGKYIRTVLVRGNHDKKSAQWYYEHGWDFVCDSFELLFHGHYVYFSHRPQPPMGHFTSNIHGHTHGNMHRSEEYLSFYNKNYHIDISPEIVGYTPISLKAITSKI